MSFKWNTQNESIGNWLNNLKILGVILTKKYKRQWVYTKMYSLKVKASGKARRLPLVSYDRVLKGVG